MAKQVSARVTVNIQFDQIAQLRKDKTELVNINLKLINENQQLKNDITHSENVIKNLQKQIENAK